MQAEIITIGNEILNGNTVNTNATFISKKLHEIGISTFSVQTVGDNREAINDALQLSTERSEIILLTGGLGPTHDDITKKEVAEFFGKQLLFDQDILEDVKKRFKDRGMRMPETNRTQAMVPEGTELMENPVGTARGMIFNENERLVFVMPGVPREMKAMMEEAVIPKLQEKYPTSRVQVDIFRTTGIPESAIYEKTQNDLEKFSSYEIAFLPKFTGVDIRIVRRDEDIENSEKFEEFKNMLNKHISTYIYTVDDRELEQVIGELLRNRNLTLSVAESLTGGMVQDKITNIPGSSAYFLGGLICYSNDAKMQFVGVTEESLQKYGAVSEQVAKEMASGAQKAFSSDIAVATTGIAGPSGATETKPVGLVYIGIADADRVSAIKYNFGDDRLINKERAAQAALEMVRRTILKLPIKHN